MVLKNMKHRTSTLPIFPDEALAKLTMPVMAILGGKDVFVDSERAKARLDRHVPKSSVLYLPEARHAIVGQTQPIFNFLRSVYDRE